MRISFEIFLLVAEELSISRASRRAFVTQQCVSDHIKRLEREYNLDQCSQELTDTHQMCVKVLQKCKP